MNFSCGGQLWRGFTHIYTANKPGLRAVPTLGSGGSTRPMTTQKKVIAAAAVVILGAGLLVAQVRQAGRGPLGFGFGGAHAARMHVFMAEFLDLTGAQKEQAKAIFQGARQSAQPIVAQLRHGHESMMEAVKANNQDQIQAIGGQQGVLAGELASVYGKAFAQFYAILTPDQQAKAGRLHDRMRDAMTRRMEAQ